MKNRKVLISVGVIALALAAYFVFAGGGTGNSTDLTTTVKRGEFRVEITTSGELEAKNATEIVGPSGLRQVGIYNVTIARMAEEGKQVKKGDWVADLDRSSLQDKINEETNEVDQSQSQYDQTQLDTALEMRAARDEIQNLRYSLREAELAVEQSAYEPPATQEKLKIDLEKAKKNLQQAIENYKLKRAKARAQMREALARLREDRSRLDFLLNMEKEFRISAPEDGMLIYRRSWQGKRIAAGDQISTWDPTVATLPDLSKMISRTYVNEVDIRKVNVGQEVNIGLDAYPEKRLTGVVTRVANVGEQKKNSDSKVFEVSIEINEADTTLRPAMTTSNTIVAEVIPNVLHLPLECLHAQGDTLTFVYVPEGAGVGRKEVRVGTTNANEAVIEAGLEEGEAVYLSVPEGAESITSIALLPKEEENTLTAGN